MIYAETFVVGCSCGQFPLAKAQQPTAQAAWQAAADHLALNPTLCKPTTNRAFVPASLA